MRSTNSCVAPEHARVQVAQRGHDRPGERGQVDDVGRAQAAGVVQAVGQHQPALGVGVRDLDRLAVGGADDVVGPHAGRRHQVLDGADHGHDLDGQLELGDGRRRLEHGGGAGHVELHPGHAAGGLEREAAAVEREPLAHEPQHHAGARRARRPVAQGDQGGLRAAGGGDRQERAHPAALEEAAVVHGGGDGRVLARDRPGALGELLRAEVVRRRVLQVAGAVHGGRHHARALRLAAVAADERDRVEPAGPVGSGIGAIAVEPVLAEQRALDEAAAGELALERHGVDDERDRSGSGRRRRPRGRRRREADVVGARRLAEAGHRDAAGAHPARGMDERHLAACAADLARVDQPLERPAEGGIDLGSGSSEHRRLRDRHHQHIGAGAERRCV